MVAVICASAIFGVAGYLWLTGYGGERALHRGALCWAVMAGVLAGAVSRTLWQPGSWGSLVIICSCPLLLALVVIDIAEHRLPNRFTAGLAALTLGGLGLCALFEGNLHSLRRALIGALALGIAYLGLALLGAGAGMGLGDVKLAPSLGALTAWFGWNAWAVGAASAFLLGGFWGVVLLLRGRGLKARMPFGPFMVAGAVIALMSA